MNSQLRQHIVATFDRGTRLDGRQPQQYREITVKTGVSKNAEGSARVTIGDTDIIVGVKMAIEKPYPDRPDEGTFMVNVELLPLCNPDFEPGPPGILAVELARVVDRGIRESDAIDVHKLCLAPGEKAWGIIMDICPINDAGNLFDAASIASLAALRNLRFPAYDGKEIDYKTKTSRTLELQAEPLEATVYKVGKHFFIDPTTEEEKVYEARLTVALTEKGDICAMQKGGNEPLSPQDIDRMVKMAAEAVAAQRKVIS